MHVEDPVRIPPYRLLTEDPHEPSQHQSFRSCLDRVQESRSGTIPVFVPVDDAGSDPTSEGAIESRHTGTVGYDLHHAVDVLRVEQRLEVGSGTGNENGDVDDGP